ncbi:MAG: phosphate ABC transporter permease PstA [Paludibacteraceae bacterium]|jgi:phosphate transport system permease protein|nr:phosphate ABC transporter permease PstA [Paludibacteraceae bacterium]NLK91561.1 phosphate ABC transporter permease PstA [Bacteroidales bacterium]MBP6436828.1 phosphate ABC transporter permease PstA [Paludibacteraceae bacterium]MBP7219714.1 phosphate ABC transporter permease PstA [Paludibacteraceae bacterium]MBP8628189.1 phosphate ABC transporter permease PstA [Paludibacteraceae bacterium]
MNTFTYRKIKNASLYVLVCLFAGLTAVPLFAILGQVLIKGWRQLIVSDFFVKSTPTTLDALIALRSGEIIPGGIANGIVGTILMVLMATFIAIPIGIFAGIYLAEYKTSKYASIIRFLTDLLQGVPSIVVGVVAFIWVVIPLKSYSALAGSAALTVMMLPLIIRSTEETMKMIPNTMKEAGLALGTSYPIVILRVMLPSAFGGIFTGVLLAVSRVIGETAPLMLTALGSTMIQWDVTRPNSAVSLLIWEFYNDPNLQSLVWSASLFLLIFVLTLNIIAKQIAKKWRIQ